VAIRNSLVGAILFLAISGDWVAWAQTPLDQPVLVIPGILGSKLCERSTEKVIWGDKWSFADFEQLALPTQYEPSQLPHVSCGLIEAVNILGPWQVHQYDDLLNTLVGLGYEKGKSLFVFDYDWRLSNRESAKKLNDFVTKNISSKQFAIVAHSMGGIVAKLWMAEYGGAARVKTLITLGTPYAGSASTFQTMDEGWGFWANLAAHGLGSVRETAMTFPSFYELLPSYQRCCGFQSPTSRQPNYFDPFIASTWARFSWLPDKFRQADRKAWLQRTLSDARTILNVAVPQGPKVITVVNSLIPTAWRVIFDPKDGRALNYISQGGDGTVVQWSAANNQLADARPALTSHQTIFADDAARQVLRWVLTGGIEPTKGVLVNIKASLRTASGALVGINSASVEIDPTVLEPSQQAHLLVELTGRSELAVADLSNVRAFIDSSPPVQLATPEREQDTDPAGNVLVRLRFPLAAPTERGAFSATVSLPSVADLTDNAVVVPK
jgi:pimeloyl-ACP methyl ester carboxylesterase